MPSRTPASCADPIFWVSSFKGPKPHPPSRVSLHMIGPETPILVLIAGVLLLIAGRRLFWLFVGLVGFFTVYQWFEPYSGAPSSWHWGLAIAARLLGILLAIFLQRFAVALAG